MSCESDIKKITRRYDEVIIELNKIIEEYNDVIDNLVLIKGVE